MITRAALPLAELGQERAKELGFNVNDYLAWLIAQDTNRPDLAPRPADLSTRAELPISAA